MTRGENLTWRDVGLAVAVMLWMIILFGCTAQT